MNQQKDRLLCRLRRISLKQFDWLQQRNDFEQVCFNQWRILNMILTVKALEHRSVSFNEESSNQPGTSEVPSNRMRIIFHDDRHLRHLHSTWDLGVFCDDRRGTPEESRGPKTRSYCSWQLHKSWRSGRDYQKSLWPGSWWEDHKFFIHTVKNWRTVGDWNHGQSHGTYTTTTFLASPWNIKVWQKNRLSDRPEALLHIGHPYL